MATKTKTGEKAVDKKVITAEALFEAGAHFGHIARRWNPKIKKFIYDKRGGIHVFDLEKTAEKLIEAEKALAELAAEGKRLIVVGTKRQAKTLVEEEAKRLGVPYISGRWLGGTISNWKQIKQSIDKLISLKEKRENGELKKYTKREQVQFDKKISRLERIVGGLVSLSSIPEVLVAIDTNRERLAVREMKESGGVVIGVVDSNGDPNVLDYPIPMNDDSAAAIELVTRRLMGAIEAGLKSQKATAASDKTTEAKSKAKVSKNSK